MLTSMWGHNVFLSLGGSDTETEGGVTVEIHGCPCDGPCAGDCPELTDDGDLCLRCRHGLCVPEE